MKLKTYLKKNNISARKFAKLAGIDHGKVSRILRGDSVNWTSNHAKICKATNGEVQPNDFVDWPEHNMRLEKPASIINLNEE